VSQQIYNGRGPGTPVWVEHDIAHPNHPHHSQAILTWVASAPASWAQVAVSWLHYVAVSNPGSILGSNASCSSSEVNSHAHYWHACNIMAYRKPTGAAEITISIVLGVVMCVANLIATQMNRISFCICGYVVFSLCEPTKSFWLTNGADDIEFSALENWIPISRWQ
jgi:hypothetical protein